MDDPILFNTFTQDYLNNEEVAEKLHQCADALRLRLTIVGLEQLNWLRDSDIGRAADVHRLMEEEKENKVLESLKLPEMKPGPLPDLCMDGTRQDVLKEIDDWVSNTSSPNILWVIGHPGVGKSAIASSVVNNLLRNKRLGASFFFQRAYASVSSAQALWRTVAIDLAKGYQSIRLHLVTKLEADPDMLTTGSIDDLFRQLIYEPLVASKNIPTKRLPVIVIDALDECGGLDGQYSRHRKNVLRTLTKWSTLPKWFKLIVTSRSEQDIDRVFRNNSHIIEIFAGSRVSLQSSEDIKAFLTARFQRITDEYSTLAPDWPGDQLIQQLTKRAGGLFIWARTVVEFMDRGEPAKHLDNIMEGEDTVGDMRALYSQILQISFQDPTSKVVNAFHAILGAIIFLRQPLPPTSVARLLSIEGTRMQHICNKLKAVVNMEDVLQINHQTFVEFLLDSKACPSIFYIRREEEEPRLAQACFQIMKRGLKFNICDIESSYALNSEIDGLDDRIQRMIPLELSYSSRHWANHLSECSGSFKMEEHFHYFMEVQFLYWLEILSLSKQTRSASTMLSLLIAWMKKHGKPYELPTDLNQFVKTFINVISQSVPHIYMSALAFVPRTSILSKLYMPSYPCSLDLEVGGLERWPISQSVMYGHSAGVASVDFSPDGLRITSGSGDDTVRVWDAETGETVAGPFQGHTGMVMSVAFSPEGKRIASGSRDETVMVWDSMTGDIVAGPFRSHSKPVYSVAFSPEGSRIVSVSDKGILILDADTGDVIAGLFGQHISLESAAFSPDGQRIVSGSRDKKIRVWDVKTGIEVADPFEGHTAGVYSVAFSPDGQRVVSGSFDKSVRVWDVNTGQTIVGPFEGHTGRVHSVAFSPDGRQVVSGSDDATVRVWDAGTGDITAGPFKGHERMVTSVAFLPDGLRIVSGSDDSTVRIWDLGVNKDVGELLQGHNNTISSLAFSLDGSRIVSGSWDCSLRTWDARTGKLIAGPLCGHNGTVSSVGFSPDGEWVVSRSNDNMVKLWDVTGKVPTSSFEGHTAEVTCVAFSPNGRQIVSGSWDETVMIWDAETGDVVSGPFQGHTEGVSSVAFLPDGQGIMSGSHDGSVRVWGIGTGKIIAGSLKVQIGRVQFVTFSPNGNQIISEPIDRAIEVWDLRVKEVSMRLFEDYGMKANFFTFSWDRKWILSMSGDQKMIVWSVETGEIASGPLIGHIQDVIAVAFSYDGRWIASGSHDKTIRVWKTHLPAQYDSPFTASSKWHEGWVMDSQNRRLFWVPPSIRDGLLRPGTECINGDIINTRLNLDSFVYGEKWTLCRGSSSPTS